MRRLPERTELHRRSLALPLAGIGICLITVFFLLLIYFGIYCLAAPEGHVMPDQWGWFWRTGAYLDRIWIGGGL